MRIIMDVELPHEPFNTYVREGSVAAKMQKIMGAIRPEAAYFCARGGKRGGTLVVNMNSPSELPSLAEPWFLTFNANVQFHPAMTLEDLGAANLDAIGKQW